MSPKPVASAEATLTQDAPSPLASPVEAPSSLDTATSEIPPSLYGRFEAFEFLGRGGMGAVYRARDFRLGRDVAIKLLFGADPERGGGLLREAQAQARITHDNVCKVYEAGTADHVRFIVMQLIHGQPFNVAEAQMTLEEKVRAVRQVASALHEAHRLGMVHRDVKPANIMVERGEDGAWKPYIMDFGVAREVGDSGATVTGALVGTPAFMSPEQAMGKIRSLDRRTDVYALGATLYAVITGRHPFVADSLLELLEQVRSVEPEPPRKLDPNVPQDLQAIVMKCLEKEPAARYESARALGEDLERFLDGDVVMARRAALAYRVWKGAKKHKVKVALAMAALLALAAMAGIWIRGRTMAAQQAELSRKLGESVKEMELFLRNAQGMPLHDVERERDIVRGRLAQIEAGMASAGSIGVGPGHYALGRGHLALQELDAALAHLKSAAAAGYRSAELDYAMGLSLSGIYKRELERTKRLEGAEKKQWIAAIEAEYKQPALAHLRAALGAAIEAPAYVEGLIAFYEGRHEEALAKAREAFEKAPWLYEAKKLEGDVLFALGSKHGHDAAFDHEKMSQWFGRAAEAYRDAADLGRSDPAVHVAACELYTQWMNGAFAKGAPARPRFEEAKAACGRAIAASPRSGAGYVNLAQAHASFAWRVAAGSAPDEKPEQVFAEAIPRAEEAVQKSPEDPLAHYVVGALWRSRALYASDRSLDSSSAVEQALRAYDAALQRDPAFLWALNEYCSSLSIRGRYESLHGVDPSETFRRAFPYCDRASAIEPSFAYPRTVSLAIRATAARHMVATGRSPEGEIKAAQELMEALRRQNANPGTLAFWSSTFHRIEATHALASGSNPEPALELAERSANEVEKGQPSSVTARQLKGLIASDRARWQLATGKDPSAAIAAAREAFAVAVEKKPWDADYRVWSAEVEITALRWALREGKVEPGQFDAARALLSPLLDVDRADPNLYAALGEIHALEAAHRGAKASEAITKGLGWIEKALAQNPRMATALACKGRLLVLRAREEKDREAAKLAAEAFSAAFRNNPLLERSACKDVEEARRLAAEDVPAERCP
ncbi:serine/threonine-protein kinase [Polyangium aurulentum]|uniref:serine/threonine-protein kinase n=1 Tax=Polyangium aurulentum TaxID=2567896 RepID=UPI00146CDFE4|nr:serine/threonine-protein kinase [Polyangium aurulentum]UQA55101.1 protein kinase [Polyangium aurulentum]